MSAIAETVIMKATSDCQLFLAYNRNHGYIALIIPLVMVGLILAVLLCIGAQVFDLIPENGKDSLKRIAGYTLSPPPDDLELHHCPCSCHTPPTPNPRTQQVIQYPQIGRASCRERVLVAV